MVLGLINSISVAVSQGSGLVVEALATQSVEMGSISLPSYI